jgi:hypothetical protein
MKFGRAGINSEFLLPAPKGIAVHANWLTNGASNRKGARCQGVHAFIPCAAETA